MRNDASAGQYAVGGIVGIITGQPVWPEYCMYNSSIVSNGFAGPIFGYLKILQHIRQQVIMQHFGKEMMQEILQ